MSLNVGIIFMSKSGNYGTALTCCSNPSSSFALKSSSFKARTNSDFKGLVSGSL
jgi:hypothetical protein